MMVVVVVIEDTMLFPRATKCPQIAKYRTMLNLTHFVMWRYFCLFREGRTSDLTSQEKSVHANIHPLCPSLIIHR